MSRIADVPNFFKGFLQRFRSSGTPPLPPAPPETPYELGSQIGESFSDIKKGVSHPSSNKVLEIEKKVFSQFWPELDDITKNLYMDVLYEQKNNFLENSIYNVTSLETEYITSKTANFLENLERTNRAGQEEVEKLSEEIELDIQRVNNEFGNLIQRINL